jgi:hypothetical protein
MGKCVVGDWGGRYVYVCILLPSVFSFWVVNYVCLRGS